MIILGDAGFNYYLDNRDDELKDKACELPITYYLVRGNHEARPESLHDIIEEYDENVQGVVRYQPRWPQVKYLIDGNTYTIDNLSTLVLGGAYSVDKLYRLGRGGQWFPDEQLSKEERDAIMKFVTFHNSYDLLLTHTCPLDWQPTDLFLSVIDQSTVDNSMETWLNQIKEIVNWKYWWFGHYHADRLERPGAIMFYKWIMPISDIKKIESNLQYRYSFPKSPFYFIDGKQ